MSALMQCHWVFDGQVPEMPSADTLRQLIKRMIAVTGLTPMHPEPYIDLRAPSWSVFQFIAESHLSAHGVGQLAWVDVFSCRPFDAAAILACIGEELRGPWVGSPAARGLTLAPALFDFCSVCGSDEHAICRGMGVVAA